MSRSQTTSPVLLSRAHSLARSPARSLACSLAPLRSLTLSLGGARATRSPQVSRPDDCSNPCNAVSDRTQDALGLIDSLLPRSGWPAYLAEVASLFFLSLCVTGGGVNFIATAISGRFSTSQQTH